MIFNRVATEFPPALARPRSPVQGARPPVPPKRRWRRWWLILLAGLLAVAFAAIEIGTPTAVTDGTDVPRTARTARVERRAFVRVLRLSGTTEAVRSRAILTPQLAGAQLARLVITRLAPAGTKVRRGDLLVEFDRQDQLKQSLEKKAEWADLVDQIAKKRAEEQLARAKDETELAQAENALKKAELEVLKSPILSRIDAEKNQQALEEARATLKQLRATFGLKRLAAEASIRILEIQRDRARQAMLHAQRNADQMSVRSPMEGVVVLNTVWKMGSLGEVQEGDEIQPGVPFMQIVDPSAMQVRVRANQADLPDLSPGQRATIRLDAYPDKGFGGKLEHLGAVGARGQFSESVRTFVALFSVKGSDPLLMPDLSAAVDVEVVRVPNALIVPYDSVIWTDGGTGVRVKKGLGFETRPVQTGPKSDTEVVIESGLQGGEEVERGASA